MRLICAISCNGRLSGEKKNVVDERQEEGVIQPPRHQHVDTCETSCRQRHGVFHKIV